jgi:hypothetical protein
MQVVVRRRRHCAEPESCRRVRPTSIPPTGAAGAREAVGASVFGFYRDEYERLIAAARDRLGDDSFKKLWKEGWVLTLHQAVDYALAL